MVMAMSGSASTSGHRCGKGGSDRENPIGVATVLSALAAAFRP